MDLLSSFVSTKITFLLVYWSLWNLNTMITKWHKIKVGFDLIYCRPYRFCGRILLWILSNSVCRHKGFCAITFLLVDWSICNWTHWPLAQNIVFFMPPRRRVGGGGMLIYPCLSVRPFVRLHLDTLFVRLSPLTVLELQL